MNNFWTQIKRPALILAPMAGITDQPFRLIGKEFGADVLYSEMISSEALFHNAISKFETRNSKQIRNFNSQIFKTLNLIKFSQAERPYVVQIFGADPEHMAYAAEYIASGEWGNDNKKNRCTKPEIRNKSEFSKFKKTKTFEDYNFENRFEFRNSNLGFLSIPNGIDVNMGCPAKDIIKIGAGAALMKDSNLAEKIIKAIKKKVKNIPISVKTRIGWNDSKLIGTFARMCEQSGVNAIAIHGRTVKQGFSGEVDWETICKVKKTLKIPVIGNGGINMNNELPASRQGGRIMNYVKLLDGIMVGQGALGRPWIFNCLKSQIANLKFDASLSDDYKKINIIKKIVLRHAKLVEEIKGERGIVEFRKHLGWYFRGFSHARFIHSQLMYIGRFHDIEKLLKNIDE